MNITAVIPTKNRVEDLLKSVQSILVQSRLPDELLIVDQSDDLKSKSEVLKFLEVNEREINLKYIYNPKISGLVEAKKVAAHEATGDIICFLEDDVVLEIDYLLNMEVYFLERPEMMGCCGVVTNVPKLSNAYALFFHFFHRGIFFDKRVGVYGHTENHNDKMISSRYLSGGTSAFRRSVFDVIKFDISNKFHMLEDIDFSMRAADHFGNEAFFINPKARLAHYMSPINRSMNKARYQKKMREFIVFYKKHTRGVFDLFALLWLLIGLFIEATVASVTTRQVSPILGYFIGLRDGVKYKLKGDF